MEVELEVGWRMVAAAVCGGRGASVGVVGEGRGRDACALVSGCESFWCLPSLLTLYCGFVCCALRFALLVLWGEMARLEGIVLNVRTCEDTRQVSEIVVSTCVCPSHLSLSLPRHLVPIKCS